jgi:hypothetical protein
LEKTQDRQIITNSVFDVAVLDTSDDPDDPAKGAERVKRRQNRAKALKERHRNIATCDDPTSQKEPEDKSEAKNSSKKTIKNKKAQATDRKENKTSAKKNGSVLRVWRVHMPQTSGTHQT